MFLVELGRLGDRVKRDQNELKEAYRTGRSRLLYPEFPRNKGVTEEIRTIKGLFAKLKIASLLEMLS